MKTLFHKITIVILLCIFFLNNTFAADIASFVIQVSPNPMKPAEAADMTIKAVKSDWSPVTDYKWTIIMDLGSQDTSIYDMPSNGFYQFTAEDQGVKTFSKGLTIKKTGQYTITVYDSLTDSVVGKLPIIVWSTATTDSVTNKLIQILEPLGSGATVEWSSLNVVGNTDSKKTPLQFFIDNKKVLTEGETDDTGNFSVYLTDILSWSHTLQVKMVDYEGKVLWESEIISFNYILPATDWFLKSFVANPDGEINAWDAVVFDAQVDGTVRSVEIKVWTMWTFIMDRTASGVFNKTVIVDKPGTHKVDVTLIFEWWQRTIYADRATLNIKWTNGVSLLKVMNNAADPSKASLSWTPVGTPASYVIRYGQSQDTLTSELKTTVANAEISWLEIGKQYFFQVFAVDQAGAITGKWSDIASLTTQWQWSAGEAIVWSSCTVVGIKIRTEKVGDQYFLMRDAIPWAVEYHIYKSDYEVNSIENMQKVWSSTIPQFAYPFDATAKKDEYTFYSVVATCSDWQNLQIDSVKKVHTWPLSDMIILFFVSLISYFLYRIYRYN
jgi:hypothetical protein